MYSWGCNGHGQLGHGTTSPGVNPAPTKIAKLEQIQVKQVACGYYHSMALTRDGKVLHTYVSCVHCYYNYYSGYTVCYF